MPPKAPAVQIYARKYEMMAAGRFFIWHSEHKNMNGDDIASLWDEMLANSDTEIDHEGVGGSIRIQVGVADIYSDMYSQYLRR
jgi:hypothetical protein